MKRLLVLARWLSWLKGCLVCHKVKGLIPGWGVYGRQLIHDSPSHWSLSHSLSPLPLSLLLPFSLKSINKSSSEDFCKKEAIEVAQNHIGWEQSENIRKPGTELWGCQHLMSRLRKVTLPRRVKSWQKSIVLNFAQRSKKRRSKISADLATWESLMIPPGAVLVE